MKYKEILEERFAAKSFNNNKISEENITKLIELIRLSASSYGLQPYKIKIIADDETKKKLLEHSYNQSQIISCSHLLVFCANTNVEEHINQYEKLMLEKGMPEEKAKGYTDIMREALSRFDDKSKLIWAQKQLYMAVTNAINGAKALGFDSCPMEGFISTEYSRILELNETLIPTIVLPIGDTDDKQGAKIRFSKEELFF